MNTNNSRNSPRVIIIVLLALFSTFAIVSVYLVENTPVKHVPDLLDKVSDKVANRFYFESPSDNDLKTRFIKNKISYELLCKMAEEDGIDRLDEGLLIYSNAQVPPQFMPGALGEKLKGKINHSRFLKYHELLCDCKVRTIARLSKKKHGQPGVSFLAFAHNGLGSFDRSYTQKYVVRFENDNFYQVENTDLAKPDKNGYVNALVKMAPHWYIWKYSYKPVD